MIILLLCVSSIAFGQETAQRRTLGISASLQGSQLDILMPIWTGERTMIAPVVGYLWYQDAGSDLRVGLVPRFYFASEKFAPYIGARVALLFSMPSTGDGTTDLLFGGEAGGEYFLDQHFSVGVEAQINVSKSADASTRFGNPGKATLNTGSAVFATIYF